MQELIESLHPIERKVLKVLDSCTLDSQVAESSGMLLVEAVRGLQWLESKGVVVLEKEAHRLVGLSATGERVLKEGFPEERFVEVLRIGSFTFDEIATKAKLDKQELNVCLGLLRKSGVIQIDSDRKVSLTGKELVNESKAVLESLPQDEGKLDAKLYKDLKSRGLVAVKETASFRYTITDLGKKLLKEDIPDDLVEQVTSDMLKDGSWEGKRFRRYDVTMDVPSSYSGKRHFVKQAIDYTKRIWIDMGFKEMVGPHVETSFWNFDALYTAQDHPVREMQDTFFVAHPARGPLPGQEIVKKIKDMHENGGGISLGWGGNWQETIAQTHVLRTHTTASSTRAMLTLQPEDYPAKFFTIGRAFRNETVDWCHLFEFNQTEGVVIDPDATFPHLLGYLEAFYKKMGFPKVRFRPAYFPYTEPSVEVDVYHPVHETWVELGGAGIFRPEVTVPLLGSDVPVLAWGQGLGRILSDYYSITDIRDLYKNDLKQIRDMKLWVK